MVEIHYIKEYCLDIDLDTTLDNTLPKELMAIEIEDLKAKNEALQKELDALRPIHNLFKRVPKSAGRGGHFAVSDEMNNVAIRALSFGCVSAKGLQEFFRILADEFPALMKPLNESDVKKEKYQIPSDSWFCDLRYDLQYVSDKQTEEFIEDAQSLFLTCDDTSTNRESKSLLGTGIINQDGVFHSFKNKLVLGSSGEEKAKHIIDLLTPAVTSRLDGIVADTLRAQQKASKIILNHVRTVTGKEDLPNEQNNCFLHTGGNVYKEYISKICKPGDKTGESLFHRVDKDLELIYGSRIGSGYHRESLRQDLESKLKKNGLRKKYFFKSRLGSRTGVELFNSMSLILYKDTIVECLNEKIEEHKLAESRKPKNKQSNQPTRFDRLLNSITNEWTRLISHCSLAIMFWYVINEPFKEAESIKTSVNRLKEILKLIDERFQVIQDCGSDHFEQLRRMMIRADCDETVKSVLQECEEKWHELNDEERKELDRMTFEGFQKAYIKFKKDTDVIVKMPDSDKVMPVSNKPQESYFSHYKRYEKHFLYMTDSMLEVIAKCKMNKVNKFKSLIICE